MKYLFATIIFILFSIHIHSQNLVVITDELGQNGIVGQSTNIGDGILGLGYNGVKGIATGSSGAGVFGECFEVNGYGVKGINRHNHGAYFRGNKDAGYADIVLGGLIGGDAKFDNGVIMSDPSLGGSDMFLIANDAVVVQIDNNNNGSGNFFIWDDDGTNLFQVTQAGNVLVKGSSVHTSDRNQKENITDLKYSEVLQAVIEMPIYEWQYNWEDRRHIGPMAQDFHAAFGLGENDKTIASIDADGVALAAIKALNQKNNSQQSEIDALRQEIAELRILLTKQIKKASED